MEETRLDRIKLWELKSTNPSGHGKENTLELWRRDDGKYLFLAQNNNAETCTPFYIVHPEDMNDLIKACVAICNDLAHVPARMPEGLKFDDEIIVKYGNGFQMPTVAGVVTDWSEIVSYEKLDSGETVQLIPVDG